MCKYNYILIQTDGFEINTRMFYAKEDAVKAMSDQYKEYEPEENDESSEEMSYLGEMDAQLYCAGESVYTWKIEELK